MSETGSTVPRRQLGRYLRELRSETGLTIAELAEKADVSSSTVQRYERGLFPQKLRTGDLRALCEVLDADENTTAALESLARQANVQSWWHEYDDLIPRYFNIYMGLEASVERMYTYSPDAVVGLLQTPDYARAMTRAGFPESTPEMIDRRVQMRIRRQSLITRRRGPAELGVVLGEGAIRREVGGRRVMAAQLRRLADMSTMPNVSLRVLPFSAGLPLGQPFGQFVILNFVQTAKRDSTEPPIVYLEHATGELYLEKPTDVRQYTESYQGIQQAALDDRASRDLLRRVAREFAT